MNTKLRNTVSAADTEAQYDEKTKQLRSNKIILAHILVKTVDEFHGMNPKDVVSYIEGDSFISVVPRQRAVLFRPRRKEILLKQIITTFDAYSRYGRAWPWMRTAWITFI